MLSLVRHTIRAVRVLPRKRKDHPIFSLVDLSNVDAISAMHLLGRGVDYEKASLQSRDRLAHRTFLRGQLFDRINIVGMQQLLRRILFIYGHDRAVHNIAAIRGMDDAGFGMYAKVRSLVLVLQLKLAGRIKGHGIRVYNIDTELRETHDQSIPLLCDNIVPHFKVNSERYRTFDINRSNFCTFVFYIYGQLCRNIRDNSLLGFVNILFKFQIIPYGFVRHGMYVKTVGSGVFCNSQIGRSDKPRKRVALYEFLLQLIGYLLLHDREVHIA